MLKTYYQLTKPGIIYGNLITVAAGFFLASRGRFNWFLLLAILIGTSFVIGSACVFNNYIDRKLDQKMNRTKKRAFAAGLIKTSHALIFATILGILGFLILIIYTNLLTAFIGLIAFFVYVVLYGIGKRHSVHGTLIGSIAGAAPIVAGYTTVTNRFDLEALLLFLILAFWQMPHFYAIAMYRFNDYKEAGLPVLPVEKGMQTTKVQILIHMIAFAITSLSLTFFGYTGYIYLLAVCLLSAVWLWLAIKGFKTASDGPWARKVFFFSLVTLLTLSVALSVGAVLP